MSIVEQDARVLIAALSHDEIARLRTAAAKVERAVVAARGYGFLSRRPILEATEACFVETGYDGTTIRAIAARLDCAVGSIYRYFTDKRELLLAVGAAAMQPVIDGLEVGDSLETSRHRYAQQARRHAQLYRLVFWLAWTPQNQAALPQPIQGIIDRWEDLLGDAAAARRSWAELHGTIMLGEATAPRRAGPVATIVGPAATTVVERTPRPDAEIVVPRFAAETEDMTLL